MRELKDISVVIPAYNAENTIGRTISALLANGVPAESIIVVNDGSCDGTAGIVKQYPAAKYIYQKNAGPAAARNTGWKASFSEVVIFTDSDCVPCPGWAEALMAGFDSSDGAKTGAVTGSYDIANSDRILPRIIHEEIKERHDSYGRFVRFFGSYNVAIKREVLEKTGGFDESYRRASGEDNDLSYRVQKLGFKIAFAPDALVGHYHTVSLKKYLREQYTHGYWRIKLYKAHPDKRGGDDYTKKKDIIEPPLSLLSLAFIVALPFYTAPFIVSTVALFAIQLPWAVKMALRKKDASYLSFAPVGFLRSYARGIGMLKGFGHFFVMGKI
ncbi:MAG: glycosyltransferase family 2 protein [Nitrospirota bacterium]